MIHITTRPFRKAPGGNIIEKGITKIAKAAL